MFALPFMVYVRLAAVLLVLAAIGGVYMKGRSDGYDKHVVEVTLIAKEKTDAANLADDAARRCAADPACSLSNDGYRRD